MTSCWPMLCGSWLHLLPARKPAVQSSKRGKQSLGQPAPNCLTSTAAPRLSSMCRVPDLKPPQRKGCTARRPRTLAFVGVLSLILLLSSTASFFATVACETNCQGTASVVPFTALQNKTPCAAGPRAAQRAKKSNAKADSLRMLSARLSGRSITQDCKVG